MARRTAAPEGGRAGAEQLHASSFKRHPAASCSASSAARTLPLRARARTAVFMYFQQRPRSTAVRRLSKPASTVKYCLWLMGLRHGQAGLASALSAWRARASGAGLEAAATTAKRYNFVNTCNYLLSWRCACSGKVRSSGRVMQLCTAAAGTSQRASSTSFWSSCSARHASPPAPARPSGPAQPRSRSRAGSTRARAAAVTRGTSAARNDGSAPSRPASATRRISAFPARQGGPRCGLALAKGGQRVPLGRTAPRWARGAGTAPPRPQRERRRRAPGRPLHQPRAPYLVLELLRPQCKLTYRYV